MDWAKLNEIVNSTNYPHPNTDCSEMAEILYHKLGGGDIITFKHVQTKDVMNTFRYILTPKEYGNSFTDEFVYHTVLVYQGIVCDPFLKVGYRCIPLENYIDVIARANEGMIWTEVPAIDCIISKYRGM